MSMFHSRRHVRWTSYALSRYLLHRFYYYVVIIIYIYVHLWMHRHAFGMCIRCLLSATSLESLQLSALMLSKHSLGCAKQQRIIQSNIYIYIRLSIHLPNIPSIRRQRHGAKYFTVGYKLQQICIEYADNLNRSLLWFCLQNNLFDIPDKMLLHAEKERDSKSWGSKNADNSVIPNTWYRHIVRAANISIIILAHSEYWIPNWCFTIQLFALWMCITVGRLIIVTTIIVNRRHR